MKNVKASKKAMAAMSFIMAATAVPASFIAPVNAAFIPSVSSAANKKAVATIVGSSRLVS